MSVLRMIKLFGWETRVKNLVASKREDELKAVWRRKLLGFVNDVIEYVVLYSAVLCLLTFLPVTQFLCFIWS